MNATPPEPPTSLNKSLGQNSAYRRHCAWLPTSPWDSAARRPSFPRLNEAHAGDAQGREVVGRRAWSSREALGGKPSCWVLQAATSVEMTCQRCLELSVHELAVDTQIRFCGDRGRKPEALGSRFR